MENDVIAIRGDGVSGVYFRDGSGAARATILVDCRTLQVKEGKREETERVLTSVTVELAGQTVAAALVSKGNDYVGTFSAKIDISGVAGALNGRVVTRGVSRTIPDEPVNPPIPDREWSSEWPFTATVVADLVGPTVTVRGLEAQHSSAAQQVVRLDVTDTGAGLRSATWEIAEVGGRPLGQDVLGFRADVDWWVVTGNPRDVPSPAELDVTIRAHDAAQPNGNVTAVALTLRDAVAPAVQIDTPVPDAEISNDGSGAAVEVTGTVADDWSGVARLEIALDDGPWIDLRPRMTVVTSARWTHTFHIPDFGRHRVAVQAWDVAGNLAPPVVREFEIAAPLAGVAQRDPFGLGSYLADLLDFAGRTVDVPRNPVATLTEQARRRLLAVEIGRIFRQPVLRVAGPRTRVPALRATTSAPGSRSSSGSWTPPTPTSSRTGP